MLLTVATEEGSTFNLEVNSSMEVESLAALLEADSGIAVGDQLLFFSGRQLTNPKESLESYGIKSGDMLLLRQKSTEQTGGGGGARGGAPAAPVAGRNVDEDSEMMRRQLLGNPQLMAQLRASNPEFAAAAENDPTKFRQFLHQMASMQESARMQQQHESSLLNADPFNIEAQRKIEEAIRQEAVLENMEQAMEQMPESFGQVHMLYVDTEVNGVPVKAFVDSGAQSTIMSPECAERCGIMRLIDKRFAGMARGVGTAKILGRVHSAQLKMGTELFLGCSFTILEGKDVDLLFGLDMLKRHQACIDLAQNALVIQGRKIPFLAEHELPKNQFAEIEVDENGNVVGTNEIPGVTTTGSSSSTSNSAASSSSAQKPFPGSGNTLGSTPSTSTPASSSSTDPSTQPQAKRARSNEPASSSTSKHPEESIQALIGLGVGREEAIRLLDSTGGNTELAARLLFSQ
ncbi:Ddi1p [Sporobolomyces salmoneus]|uniref:Ddi1p n=1 Tax=Sporobolomyces salmoneus TaxID=183962 RepID=UPI00316C6071